MNDPTPTPTAKVYPHEFRRNLPHFEGKGAPIFVTFCTRNHQFIPEPLRGEVLKHVLHDHPKKMLLVVAVVMPDHVHLIYSPREDSSGNRYPKGELLGAMKSTSARVINRGLGTSGPVWQDESFDHILRRSESIEAKAEYICMNPVRAGLVESPDDYPWLWRWWVEGEKA